MQMNRTQKGGRCKFSGFPMAHRRPPFCAGYLRRSALWEWVRHNAENMSASNIA